MRKREGGREGWREEETQTVIKKVMKFEKN